MTNFTLEPGGFGVVVVVVGKLASMRKPQRFTVQPMSDGNVMVQSDKSIGWYDPVTKRGLLNTKGCYFPHLSLATGAKYYDYPADFVTLCSEAMLPRGETTKLAGGAVILQNTIEVI